MTDHALLLLAHRAGLQVDWTDANGRQQRVTDTVLRKMLGLWIRVRR